MWKLAAVLVGIALLLSAIWLVHSSVTGVGVPYQDPTPQQQAYERFHNNVNISLFLAAGAAWLIACVTGVLQLAWWFWRSSLRAREVAERTHP